MPSIRKYVFMYMEHDCALDYGESECECTQRVPQLYACQNCGRRGYDMDVICNVCIYKMVDLRHQNERRQKIRRLIREFEEF